MPKDLEIPKPGRLKQIEHRVVKFWIEFSQQHQDSHRLPIAFFALIFLDGFLMVIPSSICLIAVVTISPRRAWLFVICLSTAATLNNAFTYFIGRVLPAEQIHAVLRYGHLEGIYSSAQDALSQYGAFSCLVGAVIGLPTQMITAILGMNDAQMLLQNPLAATSFVGSIGFAFSGHLFKATVIAWLTRQGWLKVQNKFKLGKI